MLVEDEDELRTIAARNDAPIMESPAEGPGFPPYVLAGFGATFDRPWLPALIHWPVPASQRPAALDADHRRMPTGLSCVEVSGPEDDLRRWCGGLPDGLRVLPGTSGPRRVEVAFADGGTVTFGVDSGAG